MCNPAGYLLLECPMTPSIALKDRRSIRAFQNKAVPVESVTAIIDAARQTASSSNMQPWRLYVMAGDDLDQLRGAVRQSLAANPTGEGAEYKIYAEPLKDIYNARRKQCAEDMYATIGIARENKLGRMIQFSRNFDFFGAPVGMILAIDRTMEPGQWADVGMFLQSLLLVAHEHGLGVCAQAAWAAMPKTVGAHLALPPELMIFCGISMGYADPDAPINDTVTGRADFDAIAELRGFAA